MKSLIFTLFLVSSRLIFGAQEAETETPTEESLFEAKKIDQYFSVGFGGRPSGAVKVNVGMHPKFSERNTLDYGLSGSTKKVKSKVKGHIKAIHYFRPEEDGQLFLGAGGVSNANILLTESETLSLKPVYGPAIICGKQFKNGERKTQSVQVEVSTFSPFEPSAFYLPAVNVKYGKSF